jgi:hypothetical protein
LIGPPKKSEEPKGFLPKENKHYTGKKEKIPTTEDTR